MNFTAEPWKLRNQKPAGARAQIICSDGLAPFALERTEEEVAFNLALVVKAPALFNSLLKLCTLIEADAEIHAAYNEAIQVLKEANNEH